MKLTAGQSAAIDYIGRHRRTGAKVGAGTRCTRRMFLWLKRRNLAMENGDHVMLTWLGEQEFTKLHPRSKYAIGKEKKS